MALLAGALAGPAEAVPVRPSSGFEVMGPAAGSGAAVSTLIFLSGDLGWRVSMARKASAQLVEAGHVVVGLDSLAFFAAPRSPSEVAAWIGEAVRQPGVPRAGPIILAGQSFGADQILPALAHLSPEVRDRLAGIVLVVPGIARYDHVSLAERLGIGPAEDATPFTRSVPRTLPLLCIQGVGETDSLCPRFANPRVDRIALPGGHMLDHDSDALGLAIRRWLDRQTRR